MQETNILHFLKEKQPRKSRTKRDTTFRMLLEKNPFMKYVRNESEWEAEHTVPP